NVRKMLPRLFHAGEIASPARGLYTALERTNLPENKDIPTETSVSNVSNVSSQEPKQEEDSAASNDESTQGENKVVTTETNVTNDERTHIENNAVPTGCMN